MKTFVAVCAKNGQRVELSLTKATVDEARAELHHQGYSIIEIREASGSEPAATGSTFYFDILIDGNKKSGQIRSSDVFRAYIKLTDDLHYQVLAIYDNPAATEEEKRFTTNKIRETYEVYRLQKTGKIQKDEDEKKKKPEEGEGLGGESVLARQVAKYHALIEKIIAKIEFLLASYPAQLGEERVFRLKELVTSLKQLKNITNPEKLKLIGESALDRIGQLEIELIEKGFIREKKDALGQTNVLLREIGSKKRVILPEDDFVAQAKIFWNSFRENYFSQPAKAASSVSSGTPDLATASSEFMYFKNVRELKAYEAKRDEINRELLKGFFSLKGEKKERLIMKRKLIEQNVELLTSRIKNRSVSYVKLKRGVSQYSESFFFLIRSLGDMFTYAVLTYALVFATHSSASAVLENSPSPHRFVFALAAFSFVGFLAKQCRSWTSFSVSSATAFVFVSALSVNF